MLNWLKNGFKKREFVETNPHIFQKCLCKTFYHRQNVCNDENRGDVETSPGLLLKYTLEKNLHSTCPGYLQGLVTPLCQIPRFQAGYKTRLRYLRQ